jgi:SAM-dependent methyltransferase
MANPFILNSLNKVWSAQNAPGNRVLDLSCGKGATARLLAGLGYDVVATEYGRPQAMGERIQTVGGVDLNRYLPFKDGSFDGVNLVEVIEHIEHQAQLIREISRVLKENGSVIISTPNVLNAFSRIRFLFTGFMRGRVRPVHYSHRPGRAHNVYMIHFYELYYLLFHCGFEIQELKKTRIKFASLFFGILLYPFFWLFSLEAIIRAEKDPLQKRYNWQILRLFMSTPLLLSDNIVVRARKKVGKNERYRPILSVDREGRDVTYEEVYEEQHESKRVQGKHMRPPSRRRLERLSTFK